MIQNTVKILLIMLFVTSACKTVVEKESALEGGSYHISSDILKEKYSMTLEMPDSLTSVLICSQESHDWNIEHVKGLIFFIESKQHETYLSLLGSLEGGFTPVFKEEADEESEWIIQEYNNERYKIISKKHGLCMRLGGIYTDSERPVEFAKCSNSPYEFWSLLELK